MTFELKNDKKDAVFVPEYAIEKEMAKALSDLCAACGLRQRLGDFTMFCPHCGADMRGGGGDGE